jgi:chromosome segregation ATPase
MIEPIMFFGLGFLAALLLALVILPLVHARAVRLTTRRLEAAIPVSISEIQADKDQLRAEFAMSTRRLEMSVEQLRGKTTGQLVDLGRKTEAINALKAELTEKTATIFALESRDKTLKDRVETTGQELAATTTTLRETEKTLAEKEAELAKVSMDLEERAMTGDSQRIEMVALKTQIATLKDQIADFEQQVKTTEDRLARQRADAEQAGKELADERGKVGNLAPRLAQMERQLAAQTAEAEMQGRRVAELEGLLAAHGRSLAEATRERDQLRLDLEVARSLEAELRNDLAGLERTREERAKLARDFATYKRETEATWANERVENAMMRERINDVAAQVASLTTQLEGPGSPIDTILAADAIGTPINGNGAKAGGKGGAVAMPGKGSLADRIRALQSRAGRMA